MDTKPLERFATWARRELINAVEAQTTAVLAVGSIARSERPGVVKKLEAEIGRRGRQNIVDKVAYTWFNRVIALRFMDARGYSDAGVVSPAKGQAYGQPEILSDAKRGNLDTDVLTNSRAASAIIGLLDGTRRSTDAEGEAYALLLTEYCRHWHKPMPFMFEREDDYTGLLVPANLLADGAILARAREVLTEDLCDDVEVIGWLYQFYISERKNGVFAGFKKNKKAGAGEIPAATQLFTPHWIVRYLVENSLGRLWMLNRPTSRLVDKMDYFIAPVDEETDFLKISKPEELTVIDPACGSGHMLTYAFDLLYAIYEEEGYAPSEIPSLILAHNLHGAEIDPRAGALAAFALTMKARARDRRFFNKGAAPKICVIEPISFGQEELDFLCTRDGDRQTEETFWNQFREADTLGSLIRPDVELTERAVGALKAIDDDYDLIHESTLELARKAVAQAQALSRSYSAVTANPPYMGSKNMDALLATFAKDRFPDSKSDLFAMFIERAAEMLSPLGYMAQVTMQSWMFLSSYEELRRSLVRTASIESLLHMDNMVMRIAFGTSATIWKIGGSQRRLGVFTYVEMGDLGDGNVPTQFPADNSRTRTAGGSRTFLRSAEDFSKVPGSPIAYWLSDAIREAFGLGKPLAKLANPRQGLATAENARFLRSWWEVSASRSAFGCADRDEAVESGSRWFPYNKGGKYRKWWGNHEHVVNWENDGAEIRVFGSEGGGRPRSVARNTATYFLPSVSWSKVSSGAPAFRMYPPGFVYDVAGTSIFASSSERRHELAAFANSSIALEMLKAIAPTLNYEVGQISQLPVVALGETVAGELAAQAVEISREDWNGFEISWDFESPSLLVTGAGSLEDRFVQQSHRWRNQAARLQVVEIENNRVVSRAYRVDEAVPVDVPLSRVSLMRNVEYRYGPGKTPAEYEVLERADVVKEIISYAVGCIFGRYSLDRSGLILADQGATLQQYLSKVASPTFRPDADNVIPFVDEGWFEDDIVERFRQFVRAAFGVEHFAENLRFVEESLGVNTLRDYFITKAGKSKFYDDHVQRYKKRPIYWMFSSPKGSFNALIYMHRYTPSTVSTMLNEYLREYRAKLEVALPNAEQAAARGGSTKEQKEADRLRRVLVELAEYEHNVLYPLATKQIVIDLDDGVKANYPKFYPALKNIAGLEVSE
jgi:hypothetical protein